MLLPATLAKYCHLVYFRGCGGRETPAPCDCLPPAPSPPFSCRHSRAGIGMGIKMGIGKGVVNHPEVSLPGPHEQDRKGRYEQSRTARHEQSRKVRHEQCHKARHEQCRKADTGGCRGRKPPLCFLKTILGGCGGAGPRGCYRHGGCIFDLPPHDMCEYKMCGSVFDPPFSPRT